MQRSFANRMPCNRLTVNNANAARNGAALAVKSVAYRRFLPPNSVSVTELGEPSRGIRVMERLTAVSDQQDVSVFDNIFFAFQPQQTFVLAARISVLSNEIVIMDDFRTNESLGEVGVDLRRRI